MRDFSKEASRREFLKHTGMASAMFLGGGLGAAHLAAAEPASPVQAPDAATKREKPFIAIQIGARSFVDEGVDKCLDTLQEKAMVNVLMPTVFTYGRGLSGRQVPSRFPITGFNNTTKFTGAATQKFTQSTTGTR
jgi:hypothetical protein